LQNEELDSIVEQMAKYVDAGFRYSGIGIASTCWYDLIWHDEQSIAQLAKYADFLYLNYSECIRFIEPSVYSLSPDPS